VIDFTKVLLIDYNPTLLLEHPLLDFHTTFCNKTSEILIQKSTYKNLNFYIYPSGRIILEGSLHKFKNNGEHNSNSFHHFELVAVLLELQDQFTLDLSKCKIQNLEFGVNLIMPFPCSDILQNLLFSNSRVISDHSVDSGILRKVKNQRNELKFYDKGAHINPDNTDSNLLRFEKKYCKGEDLIKVGIETFSDLLRIETFQFFKSELIRCWHGVLLFESTLDLEKIPKSYLKKGYTKYRDPYYWKHLNPKNRYRQRTYLNYLFSKFSQNQKAVVELLILKKCDELTT
jgi:hypothetical protein